MTGHAGSSDPVVITVSWADHQAQLARVRTAVFVDEQGVPANIEMDAEDSRCHHLLALVANRPVGTARLLADGRIGRLAVLKPYRGQGIGKQILQACVALAESLGINAVYLHAQVQTLGFYQAEGFLPNGDVFAEAGIRHQNMTRSLILKAPLKTPATAA